MSLLAVLALLPSPQVPLEPSNPELCLLQVLTQSHLVPKTVPSEILIADLVSSPSQKLTGTQNEWWNCNTPEKLGVDQESQTSGTPLSPWEKFCNAAVKALLIAERQSEGNESFGDRLEPSNLHTSDTGFNKGDGNSSKAQQFFSSSKTMKKVLQFFSPSKEDSPNLRQSGLAVKRGNSAKDLVLGIFRDVRAYFTFGLPPDKLVVAKLNKHDDSDGAHHITPTTDESMNCSFQNCSPCLHGNSCESSTQGGLPLVTPTEQEEHNIFNFENVVSSDDEASPPTSSQLTGKERERVFGKELELQGGLQPTNEEMERIACQWIESQGLQSAFNAMLETRSKASAFCA
ncbi:unnamed protein product [Cylindrotheca closterium]|uniref:Uncharacterized protein n=1 Tax=Cylindrotheca closterium TaxID=2856 RepID=A0AAD2FX40_9STRA|nr:unnamed protein product [Cylindrotheca closterium]